MSRGYGKDNIVRPCSGIGMGWVLLSGRAPVSEIPVPGAHSTDGIGTGVGEQDWIIDASVGGCKGSGGPCFDIYFFDDGVGPANAAGGDKEFYIVNTRGGIGVGCVLGCNNGRSITKIPGITGDGADGEYGIVEELIDIPDTASCFGEINGKYIVDGNGVGNIEGIVAEAGSAERDSFKSDIIGTHLPVGVVHHLPGTSCAITKIPEPLHGAGDIGRAGKLYVAINKSAGKIHPVVGIKKARDVYGKLGPTFYACKINSG